MMEHVQPTPIASEQGSQAAVERDLPRVLCVDDDVAVLKVIRRVLYTRFEVTIAAGGRAGLEAVLKADKPFAVVISDLRMPELSGIGFLQCVRQRSPLTTRVLLSGNADVKSAVDAVNAGEVFRFLIKPCQPDELLVAITAAHAHHCKAVAEAAVLSSATESSDVPLVDRLRAVMANAVEEVRQEPTPRPRDTAADPHAGLGRVAEPTEFPQRRSGRKAPNKDSRRVDGYVSTLTALLTAVYPLAADRALRIERHVTSVLKYLHLSIADDVKAAAALSQLGSVGLPRDLIDRIYSGQNLSADDRAYESRVRARGADFILDVRELALVRTILNSKLPNPDDPDAAAVAMVGDELTTAMRILDIACMLDKCETRGMDPHVALDDLAAQFGENSMVIEAFRTAIAADFYEPGVQTMRLCNAVPGMVLAADVVAPNGLLLARRGQCIGEILSLRRSASWSETMLEQPVRVLAPARDIEGGGPQAA